jgi:2-iminoacetate synthase ThiH
MCCGRCNYCSFHRNDLNGTHEAVLVQQTDTVNQLTVNLEESQWQCKELMANVGSGQTGAERESNWINMYSELLLC